MTIGSLVALLLALATAVGGTGAASGPLPPGAVGEVVYPPHFSRPVRPAAVAPPVPRPAIRHLWIPLTPRRLRETAAYARRHYGLGGWTIALLVLVLLYLLAGLVALAAERRRVRAR